jgi:hypothetical protein
VAIAACGFPGSVSLTLGSVVLCPGFLALSPGSLALCPGSVGSGKREFNIGK